MTLFHESHGSSRNTITSKSQATSQTLSNLRVRKKPEHKGYKRTGPKRARTSLTTIAMQMVTYLPRITPRLLASLWRAGWTEASPEEPQQRAACPRYLLHDMQVKHAVANTYHLPAGRVHHTHQNRHTADPAVRRKRVIIGEGPKVVLLQ